MIQFKPLEKHHFPLLLKWLTSPHIKKWSTSQSHWTAELIAEKYSNLTTESLIIYAHETPIGYVQTYNFHDSEHSDELKQKIPLKTCGVDFYIGEESFLSKRTGEDIIRKLIEENTQYVHFLVDPHPDNIATLKTYEQIGFAELRKTEQAAILFYTKTPVELAGLYAGKIKLSFTQSYFRLRAFERSFRSEMFSLCHSLLKNKKQKTDEEEIAYVQSLLGLANSEFNYARYGEALAAAQKTKNIPPEIIFWIYIGQGNVLQTSHPQEAVHAFTRALEFAQENGINKHLRSLAKHRIGRAQTLLSSST